MDTQPATNVIPFPIIPIKPADREQLYRCTKCGREEIWSYRSPAAVYCFDGAEMRPVEGQ